MDKRNSKEILTRNLLNPTIFNRYGLENKESNPDIFRNLSLFKDMNTSLLERRIISGNIDDFIGNIVRQVPPTISEHRIESNASHGLGTDRVFRSSTGLSASTLVDNGPAQHRIKGEPVIFEEGAYTRIDFTPGGRTSFDSTLMTDSLANGIKGLMELVDAIDQGRFKPASTAVGSTNLHMALIAQRLGFVIVDECRTEDGNIDRDRESFTIVGKMLDVQEKVHKFVAEGRHQRIIERSQKLTSAPQPA